MGTLAAINEAISCHHLIHSITKAEGPSTSSNNLFQRTGLLAFPRQRKSTSRCRSHRKRNVWQSSATSIHGLSELPTSIDVEGLVAEAPALLALSSDLDWQQSVAELRENALDMLSARGEAEIALERLGDDMSAWLHDKMFESILQPPLPKGVQKLLEFNELSIRISVEELRWQAALQATEELAQGVEGSFDWESEVAELRQCVAKQEHADLEHKLWNSWQTARESMDRDAELLQNDALKSESQDDSYLTLLSETGIDKSLEHANSSHGALEKSVSWWTLGVAMVGWYGSQAMDSIAAEESVSSAASEVAPGWVAPSVLAFPVVSYFLFTLYRNKVNPYAKLTDWVFGLVAMGIIGNIVLIKTVGVRLY
uniref:Uncharacterized protein n=2 Tax=Physcomitrium patens TaxID=3218 RepID=A0A2K1L919_PHYPA|nr:hypothetical protein PHYPA_000954 [Physcomitrium patens]